MKPFLYFTFWIPFLCSLGLFTAKVFHGPIEFIIFESLFSTNFFDLSIVFDTLSATMFVMVSLLFGVVGQYAFHYLDRQPRRAYFFINFLGIFLSITLMITTSSLLFLLISWVITSFFMRKLLLYNQERFQAQLTVRKKFYISLLGDLSLFTSIILFYAVTGTLAFDGIANFVQQDQWVASNTITTAISFLCLAALIKAVQFPFHFWLPETMEAPAPVSALMHAGVVNSGGFLLIRSGEFLQFFPNQMICVAFIGAISAVFGSLVMLIQNDIKRKLAFSTVSQMGMMMYACGIGAFSIALIHIVAHSLYKAHAFLSTGSLIAESQLKSFQPLRWNYKETILLSLLCLSILSLGLLSEPTSFFAFYLYGSVIALGVFQCIRATYNGERLDHKFSLILTGIFLFGFTSYILIESFLVTHSVGFITLADFYGHPVHRYAFSGTFFVFLIGFLLNQELIHNRKYHIRPIYHFFLNGAYLNSIANRILLKTLKRGSHV